MKQISVGQIFGDNVSHMAQIGHFYPILWSLHNQLFENRDTIQFSNWVSYEMVILRSVYNMKDIHTNLFTKGAKLKFWPASGKFQYVWM